MTMGHGESSHEVLSGGQAGIWVGVDLGVGVGGVGHSHLALGS